ncbi:MAG: dihydrodipicolinate synthase family protein [Armatimonadetes bacterium]|nr:dihydrodipicolinate synthase family protein [Armatimonadota bacterium]
MQSLDGIHPAIASPCDERGVFAEDQFVALARRLYAHGVHGLYVCGTTGDCYRMTAGERRRATELAVDTSRACGGKVITHVGANETAEAVGLAAHAETAGADAIASRPPMDRPPGGWADYYRELARAAGDLPVLVYYIPVRTKHQSTYDELLELLAMERVVGLKFSDYNLFLLQRLIRARPGLLVYNGFDEILVHGLLAGARGGIGMTYNLLPGLFVAIYEAARAGDLTGALARQQEVVAWLDIAFRGDLSSVFEAILRDQGMPLRCFRTSRPPLAAETEQAVLTATRRLAEEYSGWPGRQT